MTTVQMEALDFRYLLLEYYRKLHLNETELAVILMIDHLLEQKNTLVTPDLLSLKMSLSVKELDKLFVSLIERGFIEFTTGKKIKVSLKPLQKKLYDAFQLSLAKEHETQSSVEKSAYLKNIYEVFEKELKRTLSPLEFSLIGEWVDQGFSDETIINALKEALSKGKKSLRSVDKILLSWSERDDLQQEGHTTLNDNCDKNLEEIIRIAKTPWLNDDDDK